MEPTAQKTLVLTLISLSPTEKRLAQMQAELATARRRGRPRPR